MGLPCNPLNKFRWFRKWSANYRKFRSFRKFRNFRNSRNVRFDFPVTLWINFVDIVSGLANYRKFRNFRNPRKFGQGLSATLWINYIDFVNGLANYRKFRSFRSYVQSWTLLFWYCFFLLFLQISIYMLNKKIFVLLISKTVNGKAVWFSRSFAILGTMRLPIQWNIGLATLSTNQSTLSISVVLKR